MKTLKVFLASSNALEKERDEVEMFFRRENDHSDSSGINFKVIRWELMSSSLQRDRKQDEFNSEVLACDIFICLIYDKVGEFTKEEFETAYNGFKNEGRPKLYVYFANYLIKSGEVGQDFQTVNALKNEIQARGQIYREFENVDKLIRLIDMNLRVDIGTLLHPSEVPNSKVSASESEADEGYLDLQEIYMAEFAQAGESMKKIFQATEEHSAKQKEHTARLRQINKTRVGPRKLAVNQAAADLERYAGFIETETSIYSESMAKGMKAYGKSVKLLPDFHLTDSDYSQIELEAAVLKGLQRATRFAVGANSTLRESIANAPRITTQYNRAKRHALTALDSLTEALESAISQIAEVQKTIQEITSRRK